MKTARQVRAVSAPGWILAIKARLSRADASPSRRSSLVFTNYRLFDNAIRAPIHLSRRRRRRSPTVFQSPADYLLGGQKRDTKAGQARSDPRRRPVVAAASIQRRCSGSFPARGGNGRANPPNGPRPDRAGSGLPGRLTPPEFQTLYPLLQLSPSRDRFLVDAASRLLECAA